MISSIPSFFLLVGVFLSAERKQLEYPPHQAQTQWIVHDGVYIIKLPLYIGLLEMQTSRDSLVLHPKK
jgi:hypothetical protein